jgi:hypothetical protein
VRSGKVAYVRWNFPEQLVFSSLRVRNTLYHMSMTFWGQSKQNWRFHRLHKYTKAAVIGLETLPLLLI